MSDHFAVESIVQAEDGMTPVFMHLSGHLRGTGTVLRNKTIQVNVDPGAELVFGEPSAERDHLTRYALLHRAGDSYELEVLGDNEVWCNGGRVRTHTLRSGDLIEFGPGGPLVRYRLVADGAHIQKSIMEIFSDSVGSARRDHLSLPARTGAFFSTLARDLSTHTTLAFRVTVVVAIIGLGVMVFLLNALNVRLQEQLAQESTRLENVAALLAQTQSEQLSRDELAALRREIAAEVAAATERVAALEARSAAIARVIAAAARSIVFLQGAYVFENPDTGMRLRYAVDAQGRKLTGPQGQSLLTTSGDGPIVERHFTGTAFVVTRGGTLLTNRHVARSWETDEATEALAEMDLVPVMTRFIGYLPEVTASFDVRPLLISDEADLAVLQCSDVAGGVPHLKLSDSVPSAGEEVVVMGYPTGLRSMLAQSGEAFIDALRKDSEFDFWQVARQLSAAGYIKPLASRGIVGQVTPATVVYDAETTHGGSGGPVINIEGEVVAVNMAVMSEYGGSNMGIPAAFALQLLSGLSVNE
jgi:S1-C subfamily serine protease